MRDGYSKFTTNGRITIPAAIRRKHKLRAGTKFKFLEDQFGRIVLLPQLTKRDGPGAQVEKGTSRGRRSR
jgi:AbrB family looped-hinge helix DNA binding protein